MDKNFTKKLYEDHHKTSRAPGFSILKEERGKLFSNVIGKHKSVLDLGCRDGSLTKYFAEGNEVLGIDIDDVSLGEARKSLGIETMNIDLNGGWEELGDRKFDVIVAGEVIEHLYHPENIVQKARARLNDEGIFIGSVPNAFSLRNRLRYLLGSKKHTPLDDPTHINQFSVYDIRMILRKHFPIVTIIGLGRYYRLASLSPSLFAFDIMFVANTR